VNPRETFKYVPVGDRELPEAERTTFVLRPLANSEVQAMQNLTSADPVSGQVYPNTGTRDLEAARAGLVGWENMRGATGEPIPMPKKKQVVLGTARDAPTDEALNLIPKEVLDELVHAINTHARLTVDEGKG
jgi:hypothetical protein